VVVYRMMRTRMLAAIACTVLAGTASSAFGETEVLVEGLSEPSDLVLDDEHLYWTNRGDGSLMLKPKAGGDAAVLVADQDRIGRVVVDETHVYWTAGPQILKMPKAGGDSVLLAESEMRERRGPSGIAVDDSRVYWTLYFESDGFVMAVNKQGGDPERLASGQDGAFFIVAQSNHVYWSNHAGQGKQVMHFDLANRDLSVVAKDQYNPTWVAVDEHSVYWTNLRRKRGAIMRAGIDGGGVEEFAGQLGGPSVVALDENQVYWTDLVLPPGVEAEVSFIRKRSKTGGTQETVVEVKGHLWGLAVDDQHLYWTNYSEGRLGRIAK
jgi:hypothetical protein